ncbi:MAG: type IV secretory system conjugative DNA transfer family protein [Aristaeellaceae bacterium]
MYYERFMNNVHSSSGWASDEAFASSQGALKGSWSSRPDEGGVVLYNRDGNLVVDGGDECRHVLVIGATGTGKSRLVIMPSLLYSLRAKNRRSFVVFDVKGELRQATLATAQAYGYGIMNIDFRNPAGGDQWNPFSRANALYATGSPANREKAWKLLEDLIASIFNDGGAKRVDPFWHTSSADLFRGICAVLWGQGKDISLQAVLRLSDSIPADKDYDYQCQLFSSADNLPASSSARRMLAGFRNGSNQTRGNVLACYRGYLSPIIARDDVLKMVSGRNSVNFQTLGLRPTVLYISLPDDTVALGGLQGMLLTQLMQELNECAMKHGGRLPTRTEIYLDELCNIRPAIPSLETALTIARSRGIRYILAIQSYAQLVGVYGAAAETIAANCATWLSLNIAKDETFRNKLSQLCGTNALGNALITPSQLALLAYEQAIVIRERCAPYFTLFEDVGKVQQRLPLPERDGNAAIADSPAPHAPSRERW